MTFTIGTKVVLINGRGDWLEVKTTDNRLFQVSFAKNSSRLSTSRTNSARQAFHLLN